MEPPRGPTHDHGLRPARRPGRPRWYHWVTRYVRRAFLLGEGATDRKQWIEDRLEELAQVFSISVAGFAVLDNHLHLLARLDPELAQGWSDEEVVRRWGRLFPPRDARPQPLPVGDAWVRGRLEDPAWVATARKRLASLSWFMKCLKEPLARMANREEQARGAFFVARFKSIAILDEESLVATCAYIDLNPVAAGLAAAREESAHTSIRRRVAHAEGEGRTEDLRAAERGSAAGVAASSGLEESHWLCPIEDRRAIDSSRELAGVFARLGSSGEAWQARLSKLGEGRLLGRCFAARRSRLREVAGALGVRHLDNLAGCPAR